MKSKQANDKWMQARAIHDNMGKRVLQLITNPTATAKQIDEGVTIYREATKRLEAERETLLAGRGKGYYLPVLTHRSINRSK